MQSRDTHNTTFSRTSPHKRASCPNLRSEKKVTQSYDAAGVYVGPCAGVSLIHQMFPEELPAHIWEPDL